MKYSVSVSQTFSLHLQAECGDCDVTVELSINISASPQTSLTSRTEQLKGGNLGTCVQWDLSGLTV